MTCPTAPAAEAPSLASPPTTPIAMQLVVVRENSLSTIAEFPGIHLPAHIDSVITLASNRYRVSRVPDFAVASPGVEPAGLVTQKVYVTEED